MGGHFLPGEATRGWVAGRNEAVKLAYSAEQLPFATSKVSSSPQPDMFAQTPTHYWGTS